MQIIYIEDNKDFYQNISKYKDKKDKVYLKYKKQIINVSQLEKSHIVKSLKTVVVMEEFDACVRILKMK